MGVKNLGENIIVDYVYSTGGIFAPAQLDIFHYKMLRHNCDTLLNYSFYRLVISHYHIFFIIHYFHQLFTLMVQH